MIKSHILVVDDDSDIQDLIEASLTPEGYKLTQATTAAALKKQLHRNEFNLILLDLVLPDGNGLELMEFVRAHTDIPVIILSGKGELSDKIKGLDGGADDYLSKPFAMRELLSRIKARLRHYERYTAYGAQADPPVAEKTEKSSAAQIIKFGRWTLDRSRMQVYDESGRSGNLTIREFILLEYMVQHPSKVLSRENILDKIRSDEFDISDRAIDTQITRLRRKLGDEATNPKLIKSVHGAGYMFIGKIS